jgi:vancomycin resistance protein YoaR
MSETTPVVRARPLGTPALGIGIALAFLIGGLLAALLLALVVYQLLFLNRVYLGVSAMGVDLGGMTRSQAEVAVAAQADYYLNFPVTLRYGDQQWTLTARQAGAALDAAATVDEAFAVGRSGQALGDLGGQWQALRHGAPVEPVIRYDTGPANMELVRIAQSVDRPVRDAQLLIHGDLSVEAVPAQVGRALDVDATREVLHHQAMAGETAPVDLVVRETPASVAEVEEARRLAQALLSGPLTVRFHAADAAGEWQLTPAQLADMVLVTEEARADGTGRVWLALDQAKWTAYFEGLAAKIDRAPLDARFEIDPADGTLTVIQPSQVGLTLDVPQALALVAALPAQPTHTLDLPVTITQPAVPMEDMNQMGLTSLVAEATTYFQGSAPERVRNIAVATSRFHGIVVPPGAVFSFNDYLGPVTAETGFEEGLVIWGDRTAVGIGGGVCQVSTTAFRAAVMGGFEIVERWAHGYRVSWYETGTGPGLDATVYSPDVDFKFRNDTDHFLLIQTAVDPDAGTVTFRFYGTPTGRVVKLEKPVEENVVPHGDPVYQDDPTLPKGKTKQVEWPKDGEDVTVRRTVTVGDTVIHQDTFFSRYRPWRATYLVGTGGG